VNAFRVMVFVAACVGLVLYLYYPDRLWLILVCDIAALSLVFWITLKPVPEPDRAVVYRLAAFHHIAGPGYIFLFPVLDRIEGVLDMTPNETKVEVTQVRTFDNLYVRTNLEVTWRIHPDVRGHVPDKVRSMIHMTQQAREKLVEETVIHIARQVVNSYTREQLGPAANREAASATMVEGANEVLQQSGLLVDRIFWRGSPFPSKLLEAELEGSVRLQHAETLIKMVEAIKNRLPELQPEEFLALQAWLEMFQRGSVGGEPPTQAH
jgi:regulator of protease activity HflC (stomatin/prohibitin superfamily)